MVALGLNGSGTQLRTFVVIGLGLPTGVAALAAWLPSPGDRPNTLTRGDALTCSQRAHVQLEDPMLTDLHHKMVIDGSFAAVETALVVAAVPPVPTAAAAPRHRHKP